MAKHKKERSKQQRGGPAQQGREDAQKSTIEAIQQRQPAAQGSPADVARKHQRRFGHN
ncbi:hypothetical protein [Streptomyces sp. NPDC014733]|uniref:hypothetical protein n=1 Tax=Streptomyces sp. NPDC014733 TaxID=3364885 RepID=UPI0036F87BB9